MFLLGVLQTVLLGLGVSLLASVAPHLDLSYGDGLVVVVVGVLLLNGSFALRDHIRDVKRSAAYRNPNG